MRISKLTKNLRKASIQFDDLNLIFNVSMIGQANTTRLKNGNFIVDYNLTSDYAQGDREIYTTNANLTNSFKLTILYYQNSTTLITSETMTLYASAFDEDSSKNSLESLGIQVDKYLPEYYNHGIATNLGGLDITYDNLLRLQTLIINYTPITYNLNIRYFMNNGTGYYESIVEEAITFTYPQIENMTTIGQLINIKKYQPKGYSSKVNFEGSITVEDLLAESPIDIFYDKIENELTKNISLQFYKENDDNGYDLLDAHLLLVKESDFYDGFMLSDLIDVNSYRPEKYYNEGYIEGHSLNEFITYDTTETQYIIRYPKTVNTIYVEYYAGIYPNWYRLSTISVSTKYMSAYETDFSLEKIDIDLDKYQTSEYLPGKIYNSDSFETYESVINAGAIQVYYTPIDYPLVIKYYKDGIDEVYKEETIQINATLFFNNPILSDIININQNKPEGYQFAPDLSYNGEVTLAALTQASPITITYEVIEASRTKNILVKYKQELASAYSTITTILITVNESDCIGGIRLKDIINLNAYLPDYYESGVLDGASSTALVTFDQIESNYEVVYMASYYTTPIRYYIDEVSDLKWIGSASLKYRVIDFTVETTLYDLGLDVNAYKPSYASNGEIQYTGPINFTSLRELTSIDVLYTTLEEPDNPDDIDYPHRFLFLQHNDLGDYENLHPEWTMNHAYINTGVSVDDMSKLTVVMECARVDQNVPLHNVNEGYAYLFGSESPNGSFFMRFNNQTQYGTGLTGINTYEAKAGYYTDTLVLTEEAAVGFSENTGIYASDREGYSYATFTYTHNLPTERAMMPYPLYLFANNKAGSYADGLGGIGIYGCRIYYNNQLIRDMIPVQYYDKIGSQVAPSNCLYDKVTQTFFEDGTGMDSFNIIDDDRYPDTNPEHQIGHCYVKYYQDDQLFKTVLVYFRGSDFINKKYDAYTAFNVDGIQPPYTEIGYIENYDNLVFDFDNMNNNVYNVIYKTLDTQITVNYYKEDNGERVLLHTDNLPISEKDFYQAPTFGDIVRLNKYKPKGYKTDYKYEGSKVSLTRILALSPYSIVYVPETEPLQEYKTKVKYIKKVFGIREYEEIGTIELTFDQTDFRDGEYIDFYINKNLYKPEKYYLDGTTYQWYEMDERLNEPEDLKPEYVIMYPTSEESVDINYYVDEVSDEALVASTSWVIKLDDFNGEFQLPDMLPNDFINKYKPATCSGGILQNPSTWYTFESLMEVGEISIVYPRVDEPHDPESAMYEQKVLYWGRLDDNMGVDYYGNYCAPQDSGATIPYIDIGYKPKEIGRLRVEITGDAQAYGVQSGTSGYGMQTLDYLYWFGYWGTTSLDHIGELGAEGLGKLQAYKDIGGEVNSLDLIPDLSPGSKGCFGIRCHIPTCGSWVYTAEGPQSLDGAGWFKGGGSMGEFTKPEKRYHGIYGYYRKGFYAYCDDDYNEHLGYNNYGISQKIGKDPYRPIDLMTDGRTQLYLDLLNDGYYNGEEPKGYSDSAGGVWSAQLRTGINYCFANPFTIIMDAYNGYMSVYDYGSSNSPKTMIIDDSADVDIFENREQPKGSLTLFRTTNPTTGKVNIMPLSISTYPFIQNFPAHIANSAQGNPYNTDNKNYGQIEDTVLTITGQDEFGNPIYEEKKVTKVISYAKWPIPVAPQIGGAAIWRVKVYDRDRLVRDMIPVAKGDQIYNYTMPDNGLFDLVTEIFFGNANQGGHYEGSYRGYGGKTEYSFDILPPSPDDWSGYSYTYRQYPPVPVLPLFTVPDLVSYGKITTNYYNWDNTFIDNQFVNVPTWFYRYNTTIEDLLSFNDFKPNEFYLDGFLDLDADVSFESLRLEEIYNMGSVNVFYKLRTYTKTVVFYRDNMRIASKDIFYSIEDIKNAKTLEDLGIDINLYQDENYKPGRIVFNEQIIAEDDIKAFIDAPSPIVVYDKYTKEEKPNLLYLEYYRGGAYDDNLITIDPNDVNYLNCQLTGKVINPYGAIKYYNHYHEALYEDEKFDYFIPYQVRVLNHYTGIHYGPARRYKTLAMIVRQDILTIVEERNGWGRLKEYPTGWILLSATEPVTGPGQNPDYDEPDDQIATIPFAEEVEISRLTIDRLWCYIPAQESWVKAEDISYDQAGKLYNGLKINVIDLDTIDFSTVTSLEDMGIYPEKYRLRFHDYSGYAYDGEYTKEAFSNIHSIDFVYPETIYNYTCIYYKDNKADENELGRAGFSCSISDWNPDWDVFIETSWQYEEDGTPINPTIYRDTEITLTWDYFGFERNLYKPEGYPDGLYLWNPRSWQNQDIYFSFQELITTGSQYVVYPSFEPDLYKLFIPLDYFDSYIIRKREIECKQFQILADDYSDYDISVNNDMIWDIEYAQEYITRKGIKHHENRYSASTGLSNIFKGGNDYKENTFIIEGYTEKNKDPKLEVKISFAKWSDEWIPFKYYSGGTACTGVLVPEKAGDGVIFNFSNKRRNTTNIIGFYNDILGKKEQFYLDGKDNNELIPIYYNTNINENVEYPYGLKYFSTAADKKYATILLEERKGTDRGIYDELENWEFSSGIHKYLKIYKNYILTHYMVPVPKGMHYIWNGEKLQIQKNGMFDLMTGQLVGDAFDNYEGLYSFWGTGIYRKNQDPNTEEPYYYFSGLTFDSTDCNYIVQIDKAGTAYNYPDVLSLEESELTKGLIVPVSKVTSDTAHNIIGEWYYSSGRWFESKLSSMYAGDFTTTRLKEDYKTIVLINDDEKSINFYTYLNPEGTTPGSASDYSYGKDDVVLTSYYTYTNNTGDNFYFDGTFWIPESYTQFNKVDVNKTYAVTRDTDYYSLPYVDKEYKAGTLLYGERITILYTIANNPDWGYTGRGWVRINNNLDIVQ